MPNSRDFHDAQQIRQLGLSTRPKTVAPQPTREISGLAGLGRYVGCADQRLARPAATESSASSAAVFVEEDCDAFA